MEIMRGSPDSEANTVEAAILDAALALDLLDDDMDTLLMLLAIVCEQMPEDQREIASAVDSGDAQQVKKASHRLKGVLAQIGASRARDVCAQIEAAANKADGSRFGELQAMLASELDALATAIADYQAQHPSVDA